MNFLKYVGAELEESQKDYHDEFVEQLQQSVKKIKFDREMGRRYMLLEELMKDEYKAGKEEGLAEGKKIGLTEGKELGKEKALQDAKNNVIGILKEKRMPISEELESQIRSVKELQEAMQLFAIATMSDSLQSFDNELKKMGY